MIINLAKREVRQKKSDLENTNSLIAFVKAKENYDAIVLYTLLAFQMQQTYALNILTSFFAFLDKMQQTIGN